MNNKKRKLKEQMLEFHQAVCKEIGQEPAKVIFTPLHKGIACVTYNKSIVRDIRVDLDKVDDPEATILHELAHVILIRQRGMGTHTASFRKVFNKLCQEFMYSDLSFSIFSKKGA